MDDLLHASCIARQLAAAEVDRVRREIARLGARLIAHDLKALGITVPQGLLVAADEIIE